MDEDLIRCKIACKRNLDRNGLVSAARLLVDTDKDKIFFDDLLWFLRDFLLFALRRYRVVLCDEYRSIRHCLNLISDRILRWS